MDTLSKFALPAILFVLTLVFGLWLSLTGKPYNGILFNIHKLVALAAVVFIGLQAFKVLQTAPIQALIVALIVLAALCAVALFATGALLSVGNIDYALLLTIHRIGLILMTIMLVVLGYLLTGRKI